MPGGFRQPGPGKLGKADKPKHRLISGLRNWLAAVHKRIVADEGLARIEENRTILRDLDLANGPLVGVVLMDEHVH